MPEICIIPPAGEPLDIQEALQHLRVTDDDQVPRIKRAIRGARGDAEMKTRNQLLHARWKLVLDTFPMAGSGAVAPFTDASNIPAYAVILPHAPLVRVVKIEYVDMGGAVQTMPPADYVANAASMPALITPRFGKVWPIPLPQIGAVTITYDAGYASPIKVLAPGDEFTVSGPVTWQAGDQVKFSNSGGDLPSPLTAEDTYGIATAADGGKYTLLDQSGAPVTFTDTGSGTSYIGVVPDGILEWMLIRTGTKYENREEVAILARGKIEPLPFVDSLLDPFRISLP